MSFHHCTSLKLELVSHVRTVPPKQLYSSTINALFQRLERIHSSPSSCHRDLPSDSTALRNKLAKGVKSLPPQSASELAIAYLPIYLVLPSALLNKILSLITPFDRIIVSHSNFYMRHFIVESAQTMFYDLWLYIFHINDEQQVNDAPTAISQGSEDENDSSEELAMVEDGSSSVLDGVSTPVLNSRIIYWPQYKEVLGFDYPTHWKKFGRVLQPLVKCCRAAHIRLSELGIKNLGKLLNDIAPIEMISLSLINLHSATVGPKAFAAQPKLQYLGYRFSSRCQLFLPTNLVALELTSCSVAAPFLSKSSGRNNGMLFPQLKFLQVSNCRFRSLIFQKLLQASPNLVHLTLTTTNWFGVIQLPRYLASMIWNHNDGKLSMIGCEQLWEVCCTIYDTDLITMLTKVPSLRQLTLSVPMFKDLSCLEDAEDELPWTFHQASNRITRVKSMGGSPSFVPLKSRSCFTLIRAKSDPLSTLNPISELPDSVSSSAVLSLDRDDTNNSSRLMSASAGDLGGDIQRLNLQSPTGSVPIRLSLDGNDDNDSSENNDSFFIVCYQSLHNDEQFRAAFIGDNVKWVSNRRINPILTEEFSKLNSGFVKQLRNTTHLFYFKFPFF